MPRDVRSLTSGLRKGDADALREFYDVWFDRMFGMAARWLGRADEQGCLDVVQDAMLRVVRGARELPDEASLHAWVGSVVRSVVRDRLRSEVRRIRRERASAVTNSMKGPVQVEHGDERRSWICGRLSELRQEELGLLTMRFRFGWTLERIGSTLGLSPGAVDGRISRVISGLRRRALEEGRIHD